MPHVATTAVFTFDEKRAFAKAFLSARIGLPGEDSDERYRALAGLARPGWQPVQRSLVESAQRGLTVVLDAVRAQSDPEFFVAANAASGRVDTALFADVEGTVEMLCAIRARQAVEVEAALRIVTATLDLLDPADDPATIRAMYEE